MLMSHDVVLCTHSAKLFTCMVLLRHACGATHKHCRGQVVTGKRPSNSQSKHSKLNDETLSNPDMGQHPGKPSAQADQHMSDAACDAAYISAMVRFLMLGKIPASQHM